MFTSVLQLQVNRPPRSQNDARALAVSGSPYGRARKSVAVGARLPYARRVDIRTFDVFDDDLFHSYNQIYRAAELFERPDAPVWSEHEAAVTFRKPDDAEHWAAYAAFDGDTMVGSSFLASPQLDNTHMTWGAVYVAPELRRRGIGGELVEHLVRTTAEAGRPIILAEASYDFARRDDHPYRRFAEKHGFALASTEISRVLGLPVPETQLQAWIEEAAPHHTAYKVESYVGDLPDHILPSFCHVTNQLALDAPTGDIEFEAEAITPEVWRQKEAKIKEQGRTLLTTVAADERGEAVAVTNMAAPGDDPAKVFQWATLVLRGHRGHRLGLAIKARNLLELQRLLPDRRQVWTSNEEHNGPMLDINVKMGFEPVEILAEFQRKLDV